MVCYDSDACRRHPGTGESSGRVDATIVALNMMIKAVRLGLGILEEWVPTSLLHIGYLADGWSPFGLSGEESPPLPGTCFVNGCVYPFGPGSPGSGPGL